ncbi:MAG: 1-acyl-sn-glycerol-3-phosphate acyltransferase [bacterium]|nr:1-acyl-sn-glycerol-3-phosphate acyltransferase [bacterium]
MNLLYRTRRLLHRAALRPVMHLMGLRIRNRSQLPAAGPAIVVANHNSHLDTAALMAAFAGSTLDRVRPAAAADYFLRNRVATWISLRVIGVVPVNRRGGADPLAGCRASLGDGNILLVFPEGTRGEPGRMERFRSGVARLAREYPDTPVIPVHIGGTDRVMPRGTHFPRCRGIELNIGRPEFLRDPDPATALARLQQHVAELGGAQ